MCKSGMCSHAKNDIPVDGLCSITVWGMHRAMAIMMSMSVSPVVRHPHPSEITPEMTGCLTSCETTHQVCCLTSCETTHQGCLTTRETTLVSCLTTCETTHQCGCLTPETDLP